MDLENCECLLTVWDYKRGLEEVGDRKFLTKITTSI